MTRKSAGIEAATSVAFVVSLISAVPALSQGTYTDAQLKLAGQIGAVLGLVERCGSVPMPSAAIKRAMRAEGLKEADMTSETEFKARVIKQAQSMKAMESITAKAGTPEAERRKSACVNLAEMYGSSGYVRAGLASPL